MNTVLLIGHSGFLGRHVAQEFLKQNWEVVGVSRHYCSALPAIKQHQVDVSNPKELSMLKCLIEDCNINTVIDFAWDVSANCHTSLTSINSMIMTLNIAKLFVDCEVDNKNFIAIGTNAEYADNCIADDQFDSDLVVEKPSTIYGQCKFSTYLTLSKLFADNNIAFKWPRVFSAFGKYMRKTCLIPQLITAIKENKEFHIKNGGTINHFTPVEVVAKDIYELIADNKNKTTGAVNIGSKHAYSVKEIANYIAKKFNYNKLIVDKEIQQEQNIRCIMHDMYIKNTGIYNDIMPYIDLLINDYNNV